MAKRTRSKKGARRNLVVMSVIMLIVGSGLFISQGQELSVTGISVADARVFDVTVTRNCNFPGGDWRIFIHPNDKYFAPESIDTVNSKAFSGLQGFSGAGNEASGSELIIQKGVHDGMDVLFISHPDALTNPPFADVIPSGVNRDDVVCVASYHIELPESLLVLKPTDTQTVEPPIDDPKSQDMPIEDEQPVQEESDPTPVQVPEPSLNNIQIISIILIIAGVLMLAYLVVKR